MQIWEQGAEEPALWFDRFEVFRLIGPSRSLGEAYRRVVGLGLLVGVRPGPRWYEAARRWGWFVRAEAWDEVERVRLREREATSRFDARQARLRRIAEQMRLAEGVLELAELATLTTAEARLLLPTIRLWLRDLLAAERVEFGFDQDEVGVTLHFSADELGRARAELALVPGWMGKPSGPGHRTDGDGVNDGSDADQD